jgi:dynein heavy chain 1
MGGNPFGPAGTGKTESVKALGAQLGRFVLVFNCDENFDYRCATTPPQAQAHKHT